MRNQKFLIFCLLICLCLSGCSKKIDTVQSNNSFGGVEESSSLAESSEEKK